MREIKLVVCDIGGTAVEDRGEVARAFTAALAWHGVSVTAEELLALRGGSKRETIRRLLQKDSGRADAARVEAIYADFRERLVSHYEAEGVHAVPGVEQAFAWLGEQKVSIVLNTGFDRDITHLLLQALHWHAGV